jgi:phenylacetic acid degradation operon negative regulatory protein
MNPKTEELLWMLCWTCDMLSHPTFRNLSDSFEGWAYREGFLRQVQRLEKKQWIERQPGKASDSLYRLSEAGRLRVYGGRNPVVEWNRPWDGRWRLVLFDVPEQRRATRNRLRHYLRSRGFGYLQNSVWITPDIVAEERALLADEPADVESLLILEAQLVGGESDKHIVAGAWDFPAIDRAYDAYEKILLQRPRGPLDRPMAARTFQRWAREERAAWQQAIDSDPLLPTSCISPATF